MNQELLVLRSFLYTVRVVHLLNTTCYISEAGEAGSACSSIISLYGSCFSVFALLCSVLLTVMLSVCPCLPLSHIQHII